MKRYTWAIAFTLLSVAFLFVACQPGGGTPAGTPAPTMPTATGTVGAPASTITATGAAPTGTLNVTMGTPTAMSTLAVTTTATVAATGTVAAATPTGSVTGTATPGGSGTITATACMAFDTSAWTTWRPPLFNIQLQHPAEWQEIPGYEGQRLGGESGFVMTNAVGQEGVSLDQAVRTMTEHVLKPYGSDPTVETVQVDGRDARLILPAADQPQGMQGEAAVVVAYPQPVSMGGSTYLYLVIYADAAHICDIAKTIRFL